MSEVYFFPIEQLDKIKELLPDLPASLGVKVHFGEEGNTTFIPANLIKRVVDFVAQPTLVECSVLYKSPRRRASTHLGLARNHGFDFAQRHNGVFQLLHAEELGLGQRKYKLKNF